MNKLNAELLLDKQLINLYQYELLIDTHDNYNNFINQNFNDQENAIDYINNLCVDNYADSFDPYTINGVSPNDFI